MSESNKAVLKVFGIAAVCYMVYRVMWAKKEKGLNDSTVSQKAAVSVPPIEVCQKPNYQVDDDVLSPQ